MQVRRALEYLPPDAFDVADIAERLPARLTLGERAASSTGRAYLDTFDRRLRAARLDLVYEDGFLRLFDAAGRELAALRAIDEPQDPLDPATLPPGPLREA